MSEDKNTEIDKKKRRNELLIKIVGQVLILVITIATTASITRHMVLSELGMLPTSVASEKIDGDKEEKEPKPEITSRTEEVTLKENAAKEPKGASVKYSTNDKIPVIFKDERQDKLEALAKKDSKIKEYLMAYPGTTKPKGGLTEEELDADHPHFLQWDSRWGYTEYGDGIMAICGCAPTALATVVVDLTGEEVTPHDVAKYCDETGLYVENVGTDWSLFSKYARNFGVNGRILPISEDNMKRALQNGHPIILSVGKGDFTKNNGHIIVLVDYVGGKFVVRDPGSASTTGKLWTFEDLAPQIKNLWEFTKWE